ncbi:hypothetical protein QP671_27130, partial [Klebsiella pneumoniae]|nr:hypothetical protein [Klebsiella pneumoniae]
ETLDDVAEAGRITGEVKLNAVKAADAGDSSDSDSESESESAESDAANVNVSVAQSELGEAPAKKK